MAGLSFDEDVLTGRIQDKLQEALLEVAEGDQPSARLTVASR